MDNASKINPKRNMAVSFSTPMSDAAYAKKLEFLSKEKAAAFSEQQERKDAVIYRKQATVSIVVTVCVIVISLLVAYSIVKSLASGLKRFEIDEATRLSQAVCILADLPANYPANRTDIYFSQDDSDEARDFYLTLCHQYRDWWETEVLPTHEEEMNRLRLRYWTALTSNGDKRYLFGNSLNSQWCVPTATSSDAGMGDIQGYCGAPWNFAWTSQWGWLTPVTASPLGFAGSWGPRLSYAPLHTPCQSSVACLYMVPAGWAGAVSALTQTTNNAENFLMLPSAYQQAEEYNVLALNLINQYDLSVKNSQPLCLASNIP